MVDRELDQFCILVSKYKESNAELMHHSNHCIFLTNQNASFCAELTNLFIFSESRSKRKKTKTSVDTEPPFLEGTIPEEPRAFGLRHRERARGKPPIIALF